MKRLRVRKNIKISKVIMLVIALVFFFTSIIFKIYSNKASDKIVSFANIKINEFMEMFLSNNIGYDVLKKEDMDDILIITKNNNGEILYVDYDLDKAYKLLDKVTDVLSEEVTNLENGRFNETKNVVGFDGGFAIKTPLFIASSSALLANLGPDIYVPVNFVGSILTNVKSQITNYGLNNALAELYITIKLSTNIVTPMKNETEAIEYDVLVASKIINGRVPEFYGGLISSESGIKSRAIT